jgi:hypothetical protein
MRYVSDTNGDALLNEATYTLMHIWNDEKMYDIINKLRIIIKELYIKGYRCTDTFINDINECISQLNCVEIYKMFASVPELPTMVSLDIPKIIFDNREIRAYLCQYMVLSKYNIDIYVRKFMKLFEYILKTNMLLPNTLYDRHNSVLYKIYGYTNKVKHIKPLVTMFLEYCPPTSGLYKLRGNYHNMLYKIFFDDADIMSKYANMFVYNASFVKLIVRKFSWSRVFFLNCARHRKLIMGRWYDTNDARDICHNVKKLDEFIKYVENNYVGGHIEQYEYSGCLSIDQYTRFDSRRDWIIRLRKVIQK